MRMYEDMAKYVDIWFGRMDYEGQVRFILQMFKRHKMRPGLIYDVACGSGRHSRLLIDKGYKVEGVDLHEGMLGLAKKRIKGFKVYRQDMRTLRMKERADCIITMFSAINHLKSHEELKKTLRAYYANLNKGGMVIMDTMHTIDNWGDEYANARFMKNGNMILSKFDRSLKLGRYRGWVNQIYIIWEGRSRMAKIFDNKYELVLYDVEKVKRIARDAGFKCEMYHDFSVKAKKKGFGTYVFVLQKI